MNLYFFPGACSLAINIALREAKISFDLIEVDYATRRLVDGTDFRLITTKEYVPALQLDDATCLTEVIAIFDYIDFKSPEAGLVGERGTAHRQKVLEWLCFIATEIHKNFSPLFRPDTPTAYLQSGAHHLVKRMSVLEDRLSRHDFIAGNGPTAADLYLFTLFRWMNDVGLSVDEWPGISAHSARIRSREAVRSALISENLCPDSM